MFVKKFINCVARIDDADDADDADNAALMMLIEPLTYNIAHLIDDQSKIRTR